MLLRELYYKLACYIILLLATLSLLYGPWFSVSIPITSGNEAIVKHDCPGCTISWKGDGDLHGNSTTGKSGTFDCFAAGEASRGCVTEIFKSQNKNELENEKYSGWDSALPEGSEKNMKKRFSFSNVRALLKLTVESLMANRLPRQRVTAGENNQFVHHRKTISLAAPKSLKKGDDSDFLWEGQWRDIDYWLKNYGAPQKRFPPAAWCSANGLSIAVPAIINDTSIFSPLPYWEESHNHSSTDAYENPNCKVSYVPDFFSTKHHGSLDAWLGFAAFNGCSGSVIESDTHQYFLHTLRYPAMQESIYGVCACIKPTSNSVYPDSSKNSTDFLPEYCTPTAQWGSQAMSKSVERSVNQSLTNRLYHLKKFKLVKAPEFGYIQHVDLPLQADSGGFLVSRLATAGAENDILIANSDPRLLFKSFVKNTALFPWPLYCTFICDWREHNLKNEEDCTLPLIVEGCPVSDKLNFRVHEPGERNAIKGKQFANQAHVDKNVSQEPGSIVFSFTPINFIREERSGWKDRGSAANLEGFERGSLPFGESLVGIQCKMGLFASPLKAVNFCNRRIPKEELLFYSEKKGDDWDEISSNQKIGKRSGGIKSSVQLLKDFRERSIWDITSNELQGQAFSYKQSLSRPLHTKRARKYIRLSNRSTIPLMTKVAGANIYGSSEKYRTNFQAAQAIPQKVESFYELHQLATITKPRSLRKHRSAVEDMKLDSLKAVSGPQQISSWKNHFGQDFLEEYYEWREELEDSKRLLEKNRQKALREALEREILSTEQLLEERQKLLEEKMKMLPDFKASMGKISSSDNASSGGEASRSYKGGLPHDGSAGSNWLAASDVKAVDKDRIAEVTRVDSGNSSLLPPNLPAQTSSKQLFPDTNMNYSVPKSTREVFPRYTPADERIFQNIDSSINYGQWGINWGRNVARDSYNVKAGNSRGAFGFTGSVPSRFQSTSAIWGTNVISVSSNDIKESVRVGILRGKHGVSVERSNTVKMFNVETVTRYIETATIMDILNSIYGERIRVRNFELAFKRDFNPDSNVIAQSSVNPLIQELAINYRSVSIVLGANRYDKQYAASVGARGYQFTALRDFDENTMDFQANWGNGWQTVVETNYIDPRSNQIYTNFEFGKLGRAYAAAGVGIGDDGIPQGSAQVQTDDVGLATEFVQLRDSRIFNNAVTVGKFTYTWESSVVLSNLLVPLLIVPPTAARA